MNNTTVSCFSERCIQSSTSANKPTSADAKLRLSLPLNPQFGAGCG
jgi:hypothetical protein